jgi:two-component system NarL family response regulator
MNETKPIRVMVVDDHEVVRDGIAALVGLQSDMDVVGSASDGIEAIALFREKRPDVTLIDLRMPIFDGVQTITQLRGEFPGSRFIVLTTFEGDDEVLRAMKAGAQGYVLKGSRREELMQAIRDVHAGLRRVPAQLSERAFLRAADESLSTRELEVLALMARGLGNRKIASSLSISESTVKKHVNAILAALKTQNRTEAVVQALKRGLVRVE